MEFPYAKSAAALVYLVYLCTIFSTLMPVILYAHHPCLRCSLSMFEMLMIYV